MAGKLIDKKETNLYELTTLQIGSQYSSGNYIVVINQGTISQTFKVVKR